MVKIQEVISGFQSITLEGLEKVQLMDRVDEKFMMPSCHLPAFLDYFGATHDVLEHIGTRIFNYQTLYFDTSKLEMYHDHHNGRTRRYKVRYREYCDSGLRFLEVKVREKERTRKERIRVDFPSDNIIKQDEVKFVETATPYTASSLIPQLLTRFQRITLVDKQRSERITIDNNVVFGRGKSEVTIPGVTIVEVKRFQREDVPSFERNGVHLVPVNLSKYCFGTIGLNRQVKNNNFKESLQLIRKISGCNDVFAVVG
jgi:SPX domain protein involved in polyphosphate accumulation